MFSNLKWIRLTPDRAGRGGTKTGIHSFQQQATNDVRSLYGGHVYQGAWRRDFATVAYPAGQFSYTGPQFPLALHGYVYPSLTDPSATPSVTVLTQLVTAGGLGSGSQIFDVNTGAIRGAVRSINAIPATFQTIAGRCFIADGVAEALVLDDRTPAIHVQANQNLGIGTPTQALTPAADAYSYFPTLVSLSPEGTGYVYVNGTMGAGPACINTPNPNSRLGTILATDTVTPTLIDPNYAVYSFTPMAAGFPATNAVSSNTVPFAAAGTISITTGTSLVTLAGATWPANFAYCGLAINFNGYSYVILGHGVDGASFDVDGNAIALSNVQLLILGIYDGPTLVNVPYTITGCSVTMQTRSTLTMISSGVLGYSQTTHSNLVQVKVSAFMPSNQYRNLGNISLGPAVGTGAADGGIQTLSDGFMAKGNHLLTSASGPFTIFDEGAPISVEGAGVGGTTLITAVQTFVSANSVRLAALNQSGAAVGPIFAWWGNNPVISDGAMIHLSTTLTSASNPFFLGDVGQPIVVEGAGAGGLPLITTITAYVGPGQVTLGLANTSAGNVTGAHVWWRAIGRDTTTGPTYAYAWYDPETGHCSNISPLTQVPRPTLTPTAAALVDYANLTPIFPIDAGSISYPSGLDATRFSHIMFFRTLSTPGSSTLYPIGSLNPFVGKVHPGGASTRGSWNPMMLNGWAGLPNTYTDAPPAVVPSWWFDFSSDSDLLLSGGFRAPQETNAKPQVLLRGGARQTGYPYAMAYWDRRLWLVNTQEPDVIAYSCDEAQCPLGVPYESFPPTNRLRLPSVDARVIGMRTVGDMLLVTTERWAYIIAGNNESNYRLMKVSSSMPGVGTYQMDEFPTYTGAEGEPTTLFYLGRDRIVYQWTVGGQVVPISQPIQDQLDKVLSGNTSSPAFTPLLEYQNARVHCVSAWGRRLVVVAPNGMIEDPAPGPAQVHIYDINTQTWSESFHTDGQGTPIDGLAPMTTVYGLDVPVNELFAISRTPMAPASTTIMVRSWLRDDQLATVNLMDIITFPLNFDGKKTRKQIIAVNLHATTGAWAAAIYPNESTAAITAAFGPYPDPLESIYSSAGTPVDPGAQDAVIMAAQFSNAAPVVGYRFVIDVQKNADSNPAKVYAVDIAYVEYEEPSEGEA